MPAAAAKKNPSKSRAKRPGSLAGFRKLAGRKKSKPRENAGGKPGIVMRVGAGAGGFAAGNIGAYVLKRGLANKLASLQKILGPLGGALVFAALWYGTDKLKPLRKYRLEILIGSGLALAQHTLAAFVPSLAWLGGEQTPKQLVAAQQQAQAGFESRKVRYVGVGEIENERAEEQIKNGTFGKARYAAQGASANDSTGAETDPDLAELESFDAEEDDLDDLKGGIFQN